jgi:uncharacterized protein YdaU (DUF1376 family)
MFFLLLLHCWRLEGKLPNDLPKLYRLCRATNQYEKKAIEVLIETRFLTSTCGNWHISKRLSEEYDKSLKYSASRSACAKHKPNTCSAQDEHVPTQSQSQSQSQEKKENKVKIFVPPSASEVQIYMDSIGFKSSGEHFVDFYTAKGWMVGKTKMKDWKAGVRTWRANDLQKPRPKFQPGADPSIPTC